MNALLAERLLLARSSGFSNVPTTGEKDNANHEPQQENSEISKAAELRKHAVLRVARPFINGDASSAFWSGSATAEYSHVSWREFSYVREQLRVENFRSAKVSA
jgi:hypothetical protein